MWLIGSAHRILGSLQLYDRSEVMCVSRRTAVSGAKQKDDFEAGIPPGALRHLPTQPPNLRHRRRTPYSHSIINKNAKLFKKVHSLVALKTHTVAYTVRKRRF